MKKYIFISILLFVCLLLMYFNAHSADITEDTGSFRYNTASRRDPFVPLVTKEGRIAFGYGAVKSIENIRLEGIVYDPGGDSIAIINGLVLKENDLFGNIKVIKIEPDKVRLLFNQTKHVIHLSE